MSFLDISSAPTVCVVKKIANKIIILNLFIIVCEQDSKKYCV